MTAPEAVELPARADLVVVGAGAAGCVVARRAAESGRGVLLLEAGAHRASGRAGLLDVGPDSRVVTRHPAVLDGAALDLPRGRALGGSGAVNGGYCAAAHPADVASWGPDWPRRYAVGLARTAERLRPRTVATDPAAARLGAAFPGRGVPIAQARRGAARVTAFDAWDPDGAGVTVVTGAEVRALRWAGGRVGGRCDGVALADGREVDAREVVLCAGTIGTAALLLASGLGPATGHPVGHAVEEHPEILVDWPVDPGPPHGPGGPGDPGAPAPDVAALPPLLTRVVRLPLRVRGTAVEVELRPYAVPMHHVIPGLPPQPHRIGVALMTPAGRGAITPDGSGGVCVELDAHPDPADAEALAAAADLVRDRLGIEAPGARSPSTSQHLSGSARMGEVVDTGGRVLGVDALRVADASVLPSLPRRGPYFTVLAVAEDLAARIATGRA